VPNLRELTSSIYKGFTLAELLICILILGEIATFTIPKIINAQQTSQYNAIAKDDIGMVIGAYQKVQLAGNSSGATSISNLTPYMNYVSTSTSLAIDNIQGTTSLPCSSQNSCLILHNGSVLQYDTTASFGGTNTTNANWIHIDPNGTYGGTTNGADKAVGIFLYYNSRITDEGNILTGTTNSSTAYTASSSKVPPWFSWP
jgi:prepilin-type N-terminal cleavage/methylation domain-containing protein